MTPFGYGDADKAIKNFCYNVIELGNTGPTWKTYKRKDLHLHLAVGWSQSGQEGCTANPSKEGDELDNRLALYMCSQQFLAAVNNCNTDTISKKYGQSPFTWNGDLGCLDFYIGGHGDDWNCDNLGSRPHECSGDELKDDPNAPKVF
jgi:hypothetical protein